MSGSALSFWLTNWLFEPSIILGLIGLYGSYLLATGRYRTRFAGRAPLAAGQFWSFTAGVLTLAVALLSPLDRLGDNYWFSAHMVQHVLLTLVAPPLLILGTPGWLFEPLRGHASAQRIAHVLTGSYVGYIAFNVVFAIWHVAAFYDAALHSEPIHIVEHLSFIGAAVLTWMPLLSPTPLLPRLAPPLQILYLFLESIPPTILGALIAFSEAPLYAFYVNAPRLWGLSVMDDQLWAGLIMWIGGAFIWLFALTLVFFKWFNREEAVEGQEFI